MRSRLLIAIALLNLASLVHCMRVTDGIEVDVAYQPKATPAQIRTDMGYRVALERALIVLGKVELIRCDNFVADLRGLLAPARARAHVLDTPTSLGVPLIIDLMESAGTPEFAGTMKPPPGRGLTDETLDMMQNSVLIAGQVEDESTGEETPLLARIWEVLDCEVRFDRPLVFDSPVLESVSIQIDHTSWFDGIDFALQDSNAVQQQITENVRSSLQAVLPLAEADL
jgi:hypothetical protein